MWDRKNKTSKQEIVKYLGNVSQITQEMIPIDYRNDPSIVSFISRYSTVNAKKNDALTRNLARD